MQLAPFDSSFFDQPVTFSVANLDDGLNAGPTEGAPFVCVFSPAASWGGAFCEPDTDRVRREESHDQPKGRKRWRIVTATNPAAQLEGIGLDDTAAWNGLTLRILKAPYDGSQGSGVLWITECEEFG